MLYYIVFVVFIENRNPTTAKKLTRYAQLMKLQCSNNCDTLNFPKICINFFITLSSQFNEIRCPSALMIMSFAQCILDINDTNDRL